MSIIVRASLSVSATKELEDKKIKEKREEIRGVEEIREKRMKEEGKNRTEGQIRRSDGADQQRQQQR